MTTMQEMVMKSRRTFVILSVVLALLSWGFAWTNLSTMGSISPIIKRSSTYKGKGRNGTSIKHVGKRR